MKVPARWSGPFEFACNSKACAPPPVGSGGSTPTAASGKPLKLPPLGEPLTANHVRSILREELEGAAKAESHAYSYQQRGGGQVLERGIRVSRMYGKMLPWKKEIEAGDPASQELLARHLPAITKKLEARGYEVKPQFFHRRNKETNDLDKVESRVTNIYLDQAHKDFS